MSTISVQCAGCGQVFERRQAEVTRSQKLGRKFYCGLQCLGKTRDNSLYAHTGNPQTLIANNRRSQETPFRWYMKCIRYRSRNPNRVRKETDLVLEDLVQQWTLQKGVCPHTGWKLVLPDSTNGWKQGLKPNCASIDRIDSAQGYMKGNIVFVAVMYNFAKNAFQDEEVIAFCRSVTNNAAKKS